MAYGLNTLPTKLETYSKYISIILELNIMVPMHSIAAVVVPFFDVCEEIFSLKRRIS